MARRTSKKALYGDHAFRAAAAGKTPDEIRREIEARARASIRRSIEGGTTMFRPDWPWLRGLGREPSAS